MSAYIPYICKSLLQVMTLVACDLPNQLTSEGVRDAKVEVLKRMPIVGLDDVVLGQYDGYQADPSILNRNTITPTYACIKTWLYFPVPGKILMVVSLALISSYHSR